MCVGSTVHLITQQITYLKLHKTYHSSVFGIDGSVWQVYSCVQLSGQQRKGCGDVVVKRLLKVELYSTQSA